MLVSRIIEDLDLESFVKSVVRDRGPVERNLDTALQTFVAGVEKYLLERYRDGVSTGGGDGERAVGFAVEHFDILAVHALDADTIGADMDI